MTSRGPRILTTRNNNRDSYKKDTMSFIEQGEDIAEPSAFLRQIAEEVTTKTAAAGFNGVVYIALTKPGSRDVDDIVHSTFNVEHTQEILHAAADALIGENPDPIDAEAFAAWLGEEPGQVEDRRGE